MENHSDVPQHSAALEDTLSGVSYITPIPAVAMLLLPSTARSPRIRFHACQSILLNTLLMAAVFFLHLAADIERLVDGGNGAQFDWSARLLCMAVWAFASICVATGLQFRVPGVASAAGSQANGRIFQRFARVGSQARIPEGAGSALNQAVQLSR